MVGFRNLQENLEKEVLWFPIPYGECLESKDVWFQICNKLLSLKKENRSLDIRKKNPVRFQSNFTHLIRFDHSSKNDLKILKYVA